MSPLSKTARECQVQKILSLAGNQTGSFLLIKSASEQGQVPPIKEKVFFCFSLEHY